MKLPIRIEMASELMDLSPEECADYTDRVERVVDAADDTVCYTENGYFAMPFLDAHAIVVAINTHQKLVDALRTAQGYVEEVSKASGFGADHTLPTINEALLAVEQENWLTYDSGPQDNDRYTVFPYWMNDEADDVSRRTYLGFNMTPSSPNTGVSMWGELPKGQHPGAYLGKLIRFAELPEALRKHAIARVRDIG